MDLRHSAGMNKIERPKPIIGYDQDFALWSSQQAALLRAGRFDAVDIENVAEEIESLGRSDRRQIANRMKVLLAHLLKARYQPEQDKRGWKSTIVEQRRRILGLIDEGPSLKAVPPNVLDEEYKFARADAADATGLALRTLPETCPFTIEQVLDLGYYPEADGI